MRVSRCHLVEGLHDRIALGVDLGLVIAVEGRDALQDLGKGHDAVVLLVGEIGPCKERHVAVGAEKHRQRPATSTSRHELMRELIDLVEVRPLLPIDFDVDKQAVHQRCCRFVFKGLVGHYVAPVACRVSYGEQYRLVLGPSLVQGLCGPGLPIDGIVGVLQQVGAGLVNQAVRHGILPGRSWPGQQPARHGQLSARTPTGPLLEGEIPLGVSVRTAGSGSATSSPPGARSVPGDGCRQGRGRGLPFPRAGSRSCGISTLPCCLA